MATAATIYDYTPIQARVIALHDSYRTSLMNARYYARRLHVLKQCSLAADIVTALAASAAFAGLTIWKTDTGTWGFTAVLGLSAIISAIRSVLRLPEKIERYSKLHYGYMELYYRIESLISEMRTSPRIDEEHLKKSTELSDRFRTMALEGDAYQDQKTLLKEQDEIERIIPAEHLWLPSQ